MTAPSAVSFATLGARTGLLGGVAAPLLWVGAIALCAALTPAYSHLHDFISELAARDAPTELLMRWLGFGLTGALYVAFALVLAWRSRPDAAAMLGAGFIALGGIARVFAGVHPCDPGCDAFRPSPDQLLHDIAARVAFLAMIIAALYWGVVGNRYLALRRVSALGIGCGVWTMVFLVLMFAQPAFEGLWQRLASASLSLWMAGFALAVYRGGVATQPLASAPSAAAARRESVS